MINKLFTTFCCLMVVNCYADDSSLDACKECDDRDGFELVTDTSKSLRRCPCEGNDNESAKSLTSNGSNADSSSADLASSASENSNSVAV